MIFQLSCAGSRNHLFFSLLGIDMIFVLLNQQSLIKLQFVHVTKVPDVLKLYVSISGKPTLSFVLPDLTNLDFVVFWCMTSLIRSNSQCPLVVCKPVFIPHKGHQGDSSSPDFTSDSTKFATLRFKPYI